MIAKIIKSTYCYEATKHSELNFKIHYFIGLENTLFYLHLKYIIFLVYKIAYSLRKRVPKFHLLNKPVTGEFCSDRRTAGREAITGAQLRATETYSNLGQHCTEGLKRFPQIIIIDD